MTPAPSPTPAAQHVTFYGDSLTAFWSLPVYFPGKPYTNDGTPGITAVTLGQQFDASVIPTHPDVVVILAGTNDIRGGGTADNAFAALQAMYTTANKDGVRLVIATIPPMRGSEAFNNPTIINLNAQIRAYAAGHSVPLADYYSVLVDPVTGNLQDALAVDNVHVNGDGYKVMAPLAESAIEAVR